jgi:predicted transcriptional regulator
MIIQASPGQELVEFVKQVVVGQSSVRPFSPQEIIDFYGDVLHGFAKVETNFNTQAHALMSQSNLALPADTSESLSNQPVNTPAAPLSSSIQPSPMSNELQSFLATKFDEGVIPRDVALKAGSLFEGTVTYPDGKEVEADPETVGVRSLLRLFDEILCLECGKWLSVISKAHTKKHGMSIDEYRTKWGIPSDWPLSTKKVLAEKKNTFDAVRQAKADKRAAAAKGVESSASLPLDIPPATPVAVKPAEKTAASDNPVMEFMATKYTNGIVPTKVLLYLPELLDEKVHVPAALEIKNIQDSIGVRSLRARKDKVLCLECGGWHSMLSKAHTQKHNLSVDEYRIKWNIPFQWNLTAIDLIESRKATWKSKKAKKSGTEQATSEKTTPAPEVESKTSAESSVPTAAAKKPEQATDEKTTPTPKPESKASTGAFAPVNPTKPISMQAEKNSKNDPVIESLREMLTYAEFNLPDEFKGWADEQLIGIKSLLFHPSQVYCLECGLGLPSLDEEHLANHGLTSDTYRRRHKIPLTYDLVSQEILKQRPEAGEVETVVRRGGKKDQEKK